MMQTELNSRTGKIAHFFFVEDKGKRNTRILDHLSFLQIKIDNVSLNILH